MKASEGFQAVERAGLLEGLGIQLQCGMRRIDAGTAAGDSLLCWECGALSVPRKNFGLPLQAAAMSARDGIRVSTPAGSNNAVACRL